MNPDDLKEKATDLWTALLEALREDGLIAMCVTSSGPKTTSFIVNTAAAMTQMPQPWLQMDMKPQPWRLVVAKHVSGNYHLLRYCDGDKAGWYKGSVKVRPDRYSAWTFVPG